MEEIERKPIKDFDGYYVTKDGNIWNDNKKRYLKLIVKNGYNMCTINTKSLTVGRIVAEAFIPNPNNYTIVSHKNGNKTDDNAENLDWTTKQAAVTNHNKVTSHARHVIQKDTKGNIIATFNSVTEAAVAVNVDRTTVGKVLSGKNNTAGGYVFEYEDKKYEHQEFDKSGIEIKDFSNYYIYNDGRVYNKDKKAYLVPCSTDNGYEYVTLGKKGEKTANGKHAKKNMYIHILVATHFLKKGKDHKDVNHKDFNKANNHIDNLEWCTHSENVFHAANRKNIIATKKPDDIVNMVNELVIDDEEPDIETIFKANNERKRKVII